MASHSQRLDLFRLKGLTHKLSQVASPPLLPQYCKFLDVLMEGAADSHLNPLGVEHVLSALAKRGGGPRKRRPQARCGAIARVRSSLRG